MKKLLLFGVLCLCPMIAWASEKKVEKEELPLVYRLMYDNGSVEIDLSVGKLLYTLHDFLEEHDEEDQLIEGGKRVLKVDVKSLLDAGHTTFEDFKDLVALAKNQLELTKMSSNKLIALIKAANYLSAARPERSLLKELCEQLAVRITEKDYAEFIEGKGLLVDVEAVPDDVFRYELAPFLGLTLKEPQELWSESISDQGIIQSILPDGTIATARPEKKGDLLVAQQIKIADPLRRHESFVLNGEFSFNDREIFNIVFLPHDHLGIVTLDKIQVFNRKTAQRTSFIDKPIKKENWHIFSANSYMSQNLAIVFDDETIVCTSDEGLFAWKVGERSGHVIGLPVKIGSPITWLTTSAHLPNNQAQNEVCVVAMCKLSEDHIGVLYNSGSIQIWNRITWVKKNFYSIRNLENYCPFFLVVLPGYQLMWQGTPCGTSIPRPRLYFYNWKEKDFVPEEKTDFFPTDLDKPFLLIRDLIQPISGLFVMNTSEIHGSNKEGFHVRDFVKIGRSLRDCVAIPIQGIKYQRFSDFRLFDIGNGRIMLEQHDRKEHLIHRRIWQVATPFEGLSFDQVLFLRALTILPAVPRKQVTEKQPVPVPAKEKEKQGFFKGLWSKMKSSSWAPESVKEESEREGLGGILEMPTLEQTNFERIFDDTEMVRTFVQCFDENIERNKTFLRELRLTDQEGLALTVLDKLNALLDKSVATSRAVHEGLKDVQANFKKLNVNALPGYVQRAIKEKMDKVEEKELTLTQEERYHSKEPAKNEGEQPDRE